MTGVDPLTGIDEPNAKYTPPDITAAITAIPIIVPLVKNLFLLLFFCFFRTNGITEYCVYLGNDEQRFVKDIYCIEIFCLAIQNEVD